MKNTNSNDSISRFLQNKMGETGTSSSHDGMEGLEHLWSLSEQAVKSPEFSTEAAWKKFQANHKLAPRSVPASTLLAIVAGILIAIAAIWWWNRSNQEAPNEFPGIELAGLDYREALPDGTIILSEAAGMVVTDASFDSQHRRIRLKGNAYCQVKSDPEHPFMIETSMGTIQVLGTTFLIEQDNESIRVSVIEGIVSLTHPELPNLASRVVAGQKAELFSQKHILHLENVTRSGADQIILENALLSDGLALLNKNTEQTLTPAQEMDMAECRITSKWSDDQIDEIRQELELLFNANIQRANKHWIISSLDCLN